MTRTQWTPKKKSAFIKSLSKTGNVTLSASEIGLGRSRAYELRAIDPEFATAWTEAEAEAADILEGEARRRAVEGVETPVYQQGQCVGHIRNYSDTLLIFLLKGNKPEKFKDRVSSEHSGPNGGPIQHAHTVDLSKLTLPEKVALRDLIRRASTPNPE